MTVEWTAPPSPVKPVQLQTRVYRQSAGSRVTALTADPLYTDATLTSVVGVEKYIGGQVTLTATTASASDFVTFFVYNGDGSLVAPAVQDIYHRGGTTFTCTWNPTIGYDGLYYISAVATTGGYPGNTLQASYYVETGPPLPPTELLPQVGDGRVILSWTRPKANDVSHYIVYRSDGTGAETPVTTSDGQPTQAEVFVDASVTNGVTYTYRVSAVDILGKESAKSDPVTATPATPGDLTDPTPPGSLSASVAGPSVVLSWELSTDNVAVLGYMVYRDKDLAAPIARVSAGATSFIDTNAGYSQTHTYTVKAYDTSLRFSALATLANPLPAGQQNVDGWLQVGTDQQAYYTLLVSTNKPNVTMSAISQDTGKLYTPSVASGANKPAQFNNLPAGSYWVTGIYNSKAGEQRATIAVHLTADNQEATIIFNVEVADHMNTPTSLSVEGPRSGRRSRAGQAGLTMVELLIGMAIASVLSGMVLVGWFTLQDSYSSSVKSNKAREYARDGMSRMVREIRDARAGSSVMFAVTSASGNAIRLTTSFNDAKAASDKASDMLDFSPRAVTFTYNATTSTVYRTVGTGAPRALVTNVINDRVPSGTSSSTPLFTYTYLDGSTGLLVTNTTVPNQYLANIQSVQIHLVVDLNPGRSPVHMDLVSTAQLRNMRQL